VRTTLRRRLERAGEWAIAGSSFTVVLAVGAISIFLIASALALFGPPGPFDDPIRARDVFTGVDWYPISEPPKFGLVPLVLGTLWVSAGALAIAVPLGIASALCLGEVMPGLLREWLKPCVELLAAIPSVVIGFVALEFLAPLVKGAFDLRSGLTALTGSVALAIMALPTIVTVAEDAIAAVPQSYREASFALGATGWQTSWRVVLPAAAPGIFAAVVLGVGRVVGETMAVLMVTGNAAVLPHTLLEPVRTMTATIAAEMGETVQGSQHFHALFLVGAVLFAMTFALNGGAAWLLARARRKAGGRA
jgi:phosphate transport system permease protein